MNYSAIDVQNMINDGTFINKLIQEIKFVAKECPNSTEQNSKTEITYIFPQWFTDYIDEDYKQIIINKIIEATPKSFEKL